MMSNQSHINRGFWALLFVFLPTYIFSQDALERTWLWQVSGGELAGKSFIFGTTPVQDSTFFQFSNQVWKSMDKTDVFASFEEEEVEAYQPYYNASFGEFEKHYGLTPALYLQSLAKQEFKPTVTLDATNTLASLYAKGADRTPKSTQKEQRTMLREAYVTANLEEYVNLRKKMDVPESVYQRLTSRNNYKIINELIDKMRLQPVFVAVDGIYLPGQEGLVNLLRARGFQVRPIGVKEYTKVAQQIEQQKLLQAQWQQQSQPKTQPSAAPTNQETGNQTISAPTTATQNIKLDLPMGVLNLAQWSNYDLQDGKYQYTAPLRLKSGDRDGRYRASNGGLTYQVDVVDKWEKLPDAIEKLIIQNGGQLVMQQNFSHNGVSGKLVELMYAEKQISKHLLLNGLDQNVIVTVKGETPVIHTVLADRFLQSFQLEQLPPQPNGGVNVNLPNIFGGGKGQEQEPAVVVPQWSAASLNGLQFAFPADYEEQESKTADGKLVKAFISSRAVDQNTFLVVTSEKEAFDNFRLFNTAINTAAQEVRGVVEERNVMPDGRSDFAEYLLKDAVGNYYRIQYLYRNNSLYQIIAKGDKKSVYNANAQRFFQSIILY